MNKPILITGVVVLVGILVLVLVIPALFPPEVDMDADIYFTNAAGERVEIPLTQAFLQDGDEIVDLETNVWWAVTGANLKDETLNIDAAIHIKMVDEYGEERLLNKFEFTSGEPEGTKLKSWLLSDLLPAGQDYWTLHITVTVGGSIEDVSGNLLSDSVKFDRWATISWDEVTGTFVLTAGWV